MGFTTTTIDEVTEKSPAAEGGLVTGDKIVEINHQEIKEWTDVSFYDQPDERENSSLYCEKEMEKP